MNKFFASVMKKTTILAMAAMMTLGVAASVSAASKYGEDSPLKIEKIEGIKVNNGDLHTYVTASNGIRYTFYDSCMDGMTGSVPTNHSSVITLNGKQYTLRNYSLNGSYKYASVLKPVSGSIPKEYLVKSIPITNVALSKNSLSLEKGKQAKLTVSYAPSNTTDKKTVTWTTSNSSVATVSGGTITAKGAGTAKITAKMGNKTAVCTVKVTAKPKEGYVDVRGEYNMINGFRTTKGVWQWKSDNRTKQTFNTNSSNKLSKLKISSKLEETAKVRAKELSKKFSHTRPNGQKCFTAYPTSMKYRGENIAYTYSTSINDVMEMWKETNENYKNQGHRRNMLNNQFNSVGVACYQKDGVYYWVQCFGRE